MTYEPKTVIRDGVLTVSIYENPTTGYMWSFSVSEPLILSLKSDTAVRESDLCGAGRTRIFSFSAANDGIGGNVTVIFSYGRNWESAPIRTEKVSVFVSPGGEIESL